MFNYFALNDLQDRIAAQSNGILNYRLPSYGIFSTSLKTQYWYGIARNVTFGGLSMDMDHMSMLRVSKTNNNDEAIAFTQSIGSRMSAMEHLVPEQMFSTPQNQAQGISTVKALSIASQQGQKIWTINKDNLTLALNSINLGADTEMDIRNAVNAGKIVTTHEAKINFNGWVGEGYIVMEPETGAAAYMIAGGGNGGEIELDPRQISIYGTLSLFDISTFLLGLIQNAFGSFVTVVAGAYSLYGTIDILLHGKCRGDSVSTAVAIACAVLLFLAPLLPLVAGFGMVAGILFAFAFSSVQLWVYEDWEARCG